MITWDVSDESSFEKEKEEEANLCLIAKSDTEKITITELFPTCEKIEIEFDNPFNDSNTLSHKCGFLKNQLYKIKKLNEELQAKNEKYEKNHSRLAIIS